MNRTPLVSVIMGIYNCEATVAEAIESVLNQTYQNFELILCDDGSTDGTLGVAKKYAERCPTHIVLLKNEKNMGLNYTLNHCLRAAKGEYIARMDADDRSLPNRFQVEVDYLNNHPEFALVSANLEVYDDQGVWGHTDFLEEPEPKDIVTGTAFSHSACMIRKTVMDKVGGYSEGKKLMRVEDKHLWYKIYAAGYRGHNIMQTLYSYRDDRDGYRKRKLKYRFNSFYVCSLVIRRFHLPFYYYFSAGKSVLVGLLPYPLYKVLHRKKLNRKGKN